MDVRGKKQKPNGETSYLCVHLFDPLPFTYIIMHLSSAPLSPLTTIILIKIMFPLSCVTTSYVLHLQTLNIYLSSIITQMALLPISLRKYPLKTPATCISALILVFFPMIIDEHSVLPEKALFVARCNLFSHAQQHHYNNFLNLLH